MGMLGTAWKQIIEVLLPAHCIGCGRGGAFLCDACCGHAPSAGATALAPFPLDGVSAAFAYQGVPRKAVHRLKYDGLRALAAPMAQPMATALRIDGTFPDLLVPVPLHPRRLRSRGYNQSTLLAHGVGRLLGTPVRLDVITRRSYLRPQVEASSAAERRFNVRDAFEPVGRLLPGSSVVLVDDVMTSGATMGAAAEALRRAGAERVFALVFALDLWSR